MCVCMCVYVCVCVRACVHAQVVGHVLSAKAWLDSSLERDSEAGGGGVVEHRRHVEAALTPQSLQCI